MDQRSTVVYELRNPAPSSTTLLYHTPVQDGAVPPGFQQEFEGLAPAIEGGTAREARRAAATSDFDAALFLYERSEELRHKTRAEKTWQSSCFRQQQSDLCKYRVRNSSAQFQGTTARKDAEDSERNRWTTELANLLRGTQSPMGQEAVEGQALLGPESEVSSASSPGWLCAMSSPTPTALSQLTEYLQVTSPTALQQRLPQRFTSLDGVP